MRRQFTSSLLATHIVESRYYIPRIRQSRQPLQIICAGRELCSPNYLNERSTFPWYGIELVAKGGGSLVMDGKQYALSSGSLFCYGPNTPHQITANGRNQLLKYFIDLSGDEAAVLMAQNPLAPGTVLQALYPHELQDLLDRIISEGLRKSSGQREIITHYLRIFLLKLHESTNLTPGKKKSRALASYLQARELLENAYQRFTSVTAVARQLHMSPETLSRLFQRFSTVTPYQYLLSLKMNRAADLLLGSNLFVKEVAQRVGFHDALHFSRLFRCIRGVSPEEFRRLRKRHSTQPGTSRLTVDSP